MKDGELVEFNHPLKLLINEEDDETITNTSGHFARSVLATGVDSAYSLFEIAKKCYENNNKFKESQPSANFPNMCIVVFSNGGFGA